MDITRNLYVIKERERELAVILSPVKHKEATGILKWRENWSVFSVLLKASVAAKESLTEDVTDPRCLICSLTDGHLV